MTKMCTVLAVSTSGYYAWLRRCESVRTAINRILLTRIKVIHGQSRQTYGSPRIAATLRAAGTSRSSGKGWFVMKSGLYG